MQVLFRQGLMVVGFVMMVAVMEVVGKFFFLTYPLAVSDAHILGYLSLFALLVVIGVFFTTSVMIINTSVNLVHIVPDTVLSWISPNTQAAGSGSRMSGEFGQAAAGLSGYGGRVADQAMSKARLKAKARAGNMLADVAVDLPSGAGEAEKSGEDIVRKMTGGFGG